MMRARAAAILAIVILAAIAAFTVELQWRDAHRQAQANFRAASHAATLNDARLIENALGSVYENLRTIASLPGLRGIDRHATNLSPDTRTTIQHIYNNLASSIAVSEVYVTPIDFDPTRFDPVTLKLEEPIVMFDELILNAGLEMSRSERFEAPEKVKSAANVGPEEVEIYEYRELVSQASWFRDNFPTQARVNGLDVPFIASREVITCDNTHFITTAKDADRSGVIFSTPFFGMDGQLKGMVSAIVLTRNLSGLIHAPHLALVNPGYDYAIMHNSGAISDSSLAFAWRGEPDPSLIFSEAIPFSIKDWRSPWRLWSGQPNAAFEQSKSKLLADAARTSNLAKIILLAMAAAICVHFFLRSLENSRALNASLAEAHNLALKSERDATDAAVALRNLNDDVIRLNIELSDKVKTLSAVQEDAVAKAKMAQLGQLVAAVAHELRNPLGALRTSAFLLKRKVPDAAAADLDRIFIRIDASIARCDGIIAQLLDFSQATAGTLVAVRFDDWMEELLAAEAEAMPADISLTCELGMERGTIYIDQTKMRRAISHILRNAVDALGGGELRSSAGEAKRIHIVTRRTSRGIELTVSDNGIGMTQELLAIACDPLYSTKSFGVGLGLPIAARVAQAHDGNLEMSSKPGEGTSVTLWFSGAEETNQQAA